MHAMSGTETGHEPDPTDPDGAHGHDDGGHGDGGHDDHGHAGEELGPVDVQAWGALALGVAAGLLIVLCLVLTTSVLA
jgi:hypothetical protein